MTPANQQLLHSASLVAVAGAISFDECVNEFRLALVETSIEIHGSQTKAARHLGMHRNTLVRYVTQLRALGRALPAKKQRRPKALRPQWVERVERMGERTWPRST